MGMNLIVTASIIYLVLGLSHIFLTLFTKVFEPIDPEVFALNKSSYGKITSKTSLWNSGIGFHLSHSLGFLIFGSFYISIATENPELILSSDVFGLALIIVPITYLYLSIKYWFILPTIGLTISCVSYILGLILMKF